MSRFYDTLKEASRGHAGRSDASAVPIALNGSGDVEEVVQPVRSPADTAEATRRPAVALAAHVFHSDPLSNEPTATGVVLIPESIPKIVFDPAARLIPHSADSVIVEHYRRLRTKLLQQNASEPFRTLLVASAEPQEGKTLTVMNLGLSFAMLSDMKVLAVDGDVRRGGLGKLLGIGEQPGLSDVLEGSAKLENVILRNGESGLHFLMRGTSTKPPAEVLHSAAMKSHFQRMAESFDIVLVDSPPTNLVADCQLLASSCDAVLVVARAFRTRKSSLQKAFKDLSSFRIVGTVLNGGTRANPYRRYNGYY
jgi:protein-tyrosine kinase